MLRSLFRHRSSAAYTLIEQGLFSGANFIVNIFLARWMSLAMYGELTLILSLNLTVLLIYSNFLIEPISVLGVATFAQSLRRYYRTLFLLHLVLTIAFAIV